MKKSKLSEDKKAAAKPKKADKAVNVSIEPAQEIKIVKKKTSKRKILIWILAIVLFLACAGTTAYFVKNNYDLKKENKRLTNPEQAAKKQQNELLTTVGKIAELPTGETPTIATVSDLDKLKDQAFFDNARAGDKVIIYTQAKKAYLFRPSTNKVINIAPVNLGENNPAQ